jgi:hypothetical protein
MSPLIVVGGCTMVAHGLWDVYQQLRARRWPAARCRIELVEVDVESGMSGIPAVSFLTVYYSYTVAGKNYVSRQLHIGASGSVFSEARSGRYAVGQQKWCYYDARSPANAVLERHFAPTWPLLALVCGTFFAVMGLAIET